jgi:hypothetical protein
VFLSRFGHNCYTLFGSLVGLIREHLVLVSKSDYTLVLQSESEYTLCLNPSRHCVWIRVQHTFDWIRVHIVLESEPVLDIHHYSLLYTPCWSISYFRVWLDLVLQSKYNFCLSPSRPLLPQFEYTFCLTPSKPSACVRGDHTSILPLPSPEKVCVLSCSLEAFWSCYSVLMFHWKKLSKKSCSKKKWKKQQQRRGSVCVFFSFVRWCFVITFVSMLASLAQSSLGPAYYHCWTIPQLAFFANVVLVLPCLLLSATYSSTYIPTVASQGFSCQHQYTSSRLLTCWLPSPSCGAR